MFEYIPPPADDDGEGLTLPTVLVASVIGLAMWGLFIYGLTTILESFGW